MALKQFNAILKERLDYRHLVKQLDDESMDVHKHLYYFVILSIHVNLIE